MGELLTRMTTSWNAMSPARKGVLTAMGVGVLALAIVLYAWSTSPTFVTLYAGLDSSDSGRIIEELRGRGVPYELSQSGATVRVPQSQVDELRLDFAAQGLPEGGHVGFEIFSSNGFTSTDFVQRLNYQRGLQGELARTIESFPAVERARVHVVVPERSLFVDDQRPATASVVLGMRSGRRLSTEEVGGIAHLVSGAVEGLEKKHITILDSNGSMLYDGSQADAEGGFGITATQMTLQREFERQLETSAQALLDRTLGPAKAAVSVRADLNFDRIETERESYTSPNGGTPRSSNNITETYRTSSEVDGGQIPGALPNVPGADQNLPGDGGPGGGSATEYERTETTANFEVDRTLTREISAVGGVRRLSVSLLLDESVPPAQAEALQESIAAAVGVSADRGDTVVLTRLPFDRSAIEEAQAAFAEQAATDQILGYARLALPVVLLLFGFIFIRLLIRSLNRSAIQVVDVTGERQLAAGSVGGGAVGDGAGGNARQLQAPEESRRNQLESSVSKMATTQPDTVAEVVQSWLRED